MAIIQFEAGLFSLRLGHGAALTCPRHVIHSRAAASLPLKLPRCAVIFPQQHRFFDSLKHRPIWGGALRWGIRENGEGEYYIGIKEAA